jgi:hypothetical protein
MNADGLFELLDILRAALSKGRLSLAVPLLPLLRGSVNLKGYQQTCTTIASRIEQQYIPAFDHPSSLAALHCLDGHDGRAGFRVRPQASSPWNRPSPHGQDPFCL